MTAIYVIAGLSAAFIGGFVLQRFRLERWVTDRCCSKVYHAPQRSRNDLGNGWPVGCLPRGRVIER
jgi:hypothetical protein